MHAHARIAAASLSHAQSVAGDFHQFEATYGQEVVAVPSRPVIRGRAKTSSDGELLSDAVISVPV